MKISQCIIAVSLLRVISGESDLLLMKLALFICSNLAAFSGRDIFMLLCTQCLVHGLHWGGVPRHYFITDAN